MPTVLISGATNGLGAAFVASYRNDQNNRVIAIDRLPSSNDAPNVEYLEIDITSEDSIASLTQQLHNTPIDLLIHSAGIRGLVKSVEDEKPNDVAACETLDVMNVATLTQAFNVNATGTFLLIRALLPSLCKASDPKVIVMASRMGSVGNNELPNKDAGSAYAYRASKAALNAIVRSFAVDVPEVTFILCHPGRVETKLVRCVEEGAIGAEQSVQHMLPLIDKWERKDSAKFFDRFGKSIQW